MIGVLIHLIILLLVLGIVWWAINTIIAAIPGVPAVIKQVVMALFLLVVLLWVLADVLPLAGFGRVMW